MVGSFEFFFGETGLGSELHLACLALIFEFQIFWQKDINKSGEAPLFVIICAGSSAAKTRDAESKDERVVTKCNQNLTCRTLALAFCFFKNRRLRSHVEHMGKGKSTSMNAPIDHVRSH